MPGAWGQPAGPPIPGRHRRPELSLLRSVGRISRVSVRKGIVPAIVPRKEGFVITDLVKRTRVTSGRAKIVVSVRKWVVVAFQIHIQNVR